MDAMLFFATMQQRHARDVRNVWCGLPAPSVRCRSGLAGDALKLDAVARRIDDDQLYEFGSWY